MAKRGGGNSVRSDPSRLGGRRREEGQDGRQLVGEKMGVIPCQVKKEDCLCLLLKVEKRNQDEVLPVVE